MAQERILFVCIGNICRSPIAEALARRIAGDRANVESAGVNGLTGSPATGEAIDAARELGLDLTGHRARAVADLDLEIYDRIIALTPAIGRELQQRFGVPSELLIVLDVDDPFGSDLETFRRCANEIDAEVRRLLDGG